MSDYFIRNTKRKVTSPPPDWMYPTHVLVSIAVHTQNINIGIMFGMSVFVIGALRMGADDLTFSKEQASWFGGMAFLVHPVGGLMFSFVRETWSRKSFMIAMNIPQFLAYLMMYYAPYVYQLLAAQAILGITVGFMKPPLLSYLGEVLEPSLRGPVVSLNGVFLNVGVLLSTFVGASVHWRTMMLYISAMPIVSLILISLIPNSPAWLVLKGRVDDAEKAYRCLRGWVPASEVQEELNALVNYVKNKAASSDASNRPNGDRKNEDSLPDQESKLKAFFHRSVQRPLRLVLLYTFTGLCVGLFGMRSYFKEVATLVDLPMNANKVLIYLNLVTLVGASIAPLGIRLLGMRGQTFLSFTLCTAATLGLGLYVLLECQLPWVPMVLFGITYFGAYTGLFVLPWVLTSEIFPLRMRSQATGVATAMGYLLLFFVSKTFYNVVALFGLSGAFIFYGGVGVIGFIYLYFSLPETKGLSLEDIEAIFNQK